MTYSTMPVPDWIAVDWGTTHLRAWAMTGDGILAQAHSDDGMGKLQPDAFEPALVRLIGSWLSDSPMRILACGMVGARQGWAEAPYQAAPCRPLSEVPVRALVHDPRLDVRLLRGVKQNKPADVMRGEETQIAGYIAANPGFDGILCLPGTHTKWVHISAGEIVSFRTFMSGEMFALLSGQSVLRHGIAPDGWDDDAFAAGLEDAMARPEALAAQFFGLRAEGLLHGLSPQAARARLSGLLVGAELAAARPYWLGQDVALIGAPALSSAYATALRRQGLEPRIADGDAMTLAGLTAAHAQLTEDARCLAP